MSNIVKPNTALLPMDDIARELETIHGFQKNDENAPDTDNVANVDANKIAKAATDQNGELIKDRDTVLNALKLNDKNADEYMLKEDAQAVERFVENAGDTYSNEINSLRDELYQIKAELVKNGFIRDVRSYSGFNDTFKAENKKFVEGEICNASGLLLQNGSSTQYNKIQVDDLQEFYVGMHFVIQSNNAFRVVRATNITAEAIEFSPSISGVDPTNVKVFKTIGTYNNGTFVFSDIVNQAVTEKEKFTMLNDIASNRKNIEYIDAAHSGFATTFNIPNTIAGALSRFIVRGRSIGTPGSLMCYVVPKSYVLGLISSGEAINYGKAVQDNKVTARAYNIVTAPQAQLETDIEFFFHKDGFEPTIVDEYSDLCFVIEAGEGTNSLNRWEICFAKGIDGSANVQANNVTYKYTNTIDQVPHDIYFILATKEVAANIEKPYTVGLYSAKIKLPAPIEVSRARLTMRINREGKYAVSGPSGAYSQNSDISIALDDAIGRYNMRYGSGINNNEKIAIGNNIRTIQAAGSDSITLKTGVYVENGDPVYRIGYQAFLKSYLKTWNEETNEFEISNEQINEIPIIAILPDSDKNKTAVSDRLIFEKLIEDNEQLKYANEFELQIKWGTNINQIGGVDISQQGNSDLQDLVGKIYDLNLVFDKTC